MILIMKALNFLSLKNIIARFNKKHICTNVFCYKNNLVYLVHISNQKFKDHMDLLSISDKEKLHYVYIKDLTDLCAIRQKIRIKNIFASIVYNVLVVNKF